MTTLADRGLLVGRDGELALLDELVRGVAGGRGGAVWVEGEPGIGKSALLAVGLAGAEVLGCQVFAGAAEELGRRFPLRAVVECLAVRPDSPDPARRAISGLLGGGGLAGAGPRVDPVPAATEQLLAMVDRMCAAAPVVLVLDDLQWADEASLLVWHQLGRVVEQLPLLLVAAVRPVPRRAELVRLRRGLAAAGAVIVSLEPLGGPAIGALAAGLAGAGQVGPVLREALDRAAGNPLYVREMVDALRREGQLRRQADTAELADDDAASGIPKSLAAAISARLGFVGDRTLGVLRAAALLGGALSVSDLGTVTGSPLVDLAAAVEEGTAAGVLTESGVRLAFRHALIRQALSEQTPAGVRLALRRQAARALAEAGSPAERVAEQLLAVLVEDDDTAPAVDDWVVDWLLGAGRVLRYRAAEVAADLLGPAIAGLPAEDPRREPLQAALASALLLLGRREEAEPLAERVLADTRDPDRAGEMAWTLARALAGGRRYDTAREVAERALRRPDLPGRWTARLRAALGQTLMLAGDHAGAAATAEQALIEAERASDRPAAATALLVAGYTLMFGGDPAGPAALWERGLTVLGDDAESADLRLLLLQNRALALFELGRAGEAEAAFRELVAAAERSATPPRRAAVRLTAADRDYHTGRWDDALAEVEAVSEVGDRLAASYRLLHRGLSALIAAHRDGPPTSEADQAAEQPPRAGTRAGPEHLLAAQAMRAERAGHPERALAVLAEMLEHVDRLQLRSIWLPQLARLAIAAGDRALAQRAAEAAEAGDPDRSGTPSPPRLATARHCRGLLEADASLVLAGADTFRGLGRPVELARALEDAAVLLAEQADLPAARAAYAEAVEHYTALGADWDALRAETRLRPYGIRRPRRRRARPATGWDALTPAELKVAYLVADGLANPDVAARLFLSRGTVEVHVHRILAKLGARSRVEIARQAASHPATARTPTGSAAAPDVSTA